MSGQPQNPWVDLPLEPPYIAPADRVVMARHPRAKERLRLDILPYPYQGSRDAEVLLLANPGAGELGPDYPAELWEERRRSLTFTHRRDPRLATPDTWWHQRLRKLIAAVGEEAVSSGTLSVECFPYHSRRYRRFPETLPSQRFGFALVAEAVQAGKLVVVVRRERDWVEAVPALKDADYIRVRNPQVAHISPRNVGETNFERIVDRLRGPAPDAGSLASEEGPLLEGTFLRWIDGDAGTLGIVVAPVTDDVVQVLVRDANGTTDLEVFVGRPDATGASASDLVREQMGVVEPPDDWLTELLIDLSTEYRNGPRRRSEPPDLHRRRFP